MLKSHPTVASLPANKEFRNKLSAFAPVSKKHVYIVMDSDASITLHGPIGQNNGEVHIQPMGNDCTMRESSSLPASVMEYSWVSISRTCKLTFRLHQFAGLLPLGMMSHSKKAVVASAIASLGRLRSSWRWEVCTFSSSNLSNPLA